MSFQTRKTFIHLQNTNYDILDEIRQLSDPKKAVMLWSYENKFCAQSKQK